VLVGFTPGCFSPGFFLPGRGQSPPNLSRWGAVSELMTREKRSEIVKSRITPSLKEEIAQDLAEQSSVITLSDWLFEAAQMRLAMKSIHVSKQRLSRRAGQQ